MKFEKKCYGYFLKITIDIEITQFMDCPSKMDTSQDLKLIKGYQNESHTVITFQRPWQTCDTEMVSSFWK